MGRSLSRRSPRPSKPQMVIGTPNPSLSGKPAFGSTTGKPLSELTQSSESLSSSLPSSPRASSTSISCRGSNHSSRAEHIRSAEAGLLAAHGALPPIECETDDYSRNGRAGGAPIRIELSAAAQPGLEFGEPFVRRSRVVRQSIRRSDAHTGVPLHIEVRHLGVRHRIPAAPVGWRVWRVFLANPGPGGYHGPNGEKGL